MIQIQEVYIMVCLVSDTGCIDYRLHGLRNYEVLIIVHMVSDTGSVDYGLQGLRHR